MSAHVHTDNEGGKIGMWLFLFTEMMLFGGLFITYSALRSLYPADFQEAGSHLNPVFGIANTFVLLTSSLSMALCITALQKRDHKKSRLFLAITILLGCVFLANKYIEWIHEIHMGIYPSGPGLAGKPFGEILFYGLYFSMTGLHGLHVIIGIILLSVMLILLERRAIDHEHHLILENSGLYWHLIDVVWIFLMPLFYLAA
ncbi:MAG: cytochrome c oxidase subunit 3 family protein [Elusimicrobiota bacterium]